MSDPIETAIFESLSGKAPGASVEPAEAAKILAGEQWRRMLPKVKATAVGLARQGRLVITKKGKAVNPDAFKGVIRLRLPLDGEALDISPDDAA